MASMDAVRPAPGLVRRAVRLSFAQAMIGAVYGASTGGMFLIGYALALGAEDAQIGLMTTVPMLCVVAQFLAAAAVERGVPRRLLTVAASLLNVSGWALIILIPYAAAGASNRVRVGLLIGIAAWVTLFAHVAGNARGSWVGDLIPARFRGTFFGRIGMYSGIVATLFAVLEGGFLDTVRRHGIGAFSLLFGFGMLFGLAGALLFLPQPDIPLRRRAGAGGMPAMLRAAVTNRPLRFVALFNILWALQGVAGPFYPTYMLRDLHMPFLGVGIVNAFFMLAFLLSSPLWGRAIDRWGCRPVIVVCSAILGAAQFSWVWIHSAARVYAVIPLVNLVAGSVAAGVNVALNTLVYKVTPSAGRSVQFAVYSAVVVLFAAPLPTVGGYLPDWLAAAGLPRDLRFTFYAAGLFMLASALVARRIPDPGAARTRHMLRHLGNRLCLPARRWWAAAAPSQEPPERG